MKKILILFIALGLFQCIAKRSASKFPVTEKELAVAQKTWPDATLEELNEGRNIYTNKCNECHKNFNIVKFSERKWKHEINDMSPKAKLTDAEKEKLTRFILSYREANQPAPAN